MIPRSSVERRPSLPPTESAGEVALDLSDEMCMDLPDVTLEEETDGPVSNAHWPNSGLLNVFDVASLSGPDENSDNSASQGSISFASYPAQRPFWT